MTHKDSSAQLNIAIVEDESWLRQNLEREINRISGMRCVKTYRTAELAADFAHSPPHIF